MEWIKEARTDGCRISEACEALGIDRRTYERWSKYPGGDQRSGPTTSPSNKLSITERQEIISIANSSEFRDKTPCQIVPLLADKGIYVASESSFYRILKAEGLNAHRSRSKPSTRKKPKELVATSPNQIYSWDITYLRSNISGKFHYLYFVMDIYSRKIVGSAVHDDQNSEHASRLIDDICRAEGIPKGQLTLHSDNGSPMKGATMLATLQKLGVVPSFSRPSVSDDNPFSEALFKTTKYCPQFPSKPFESIVSAIEWVATFVLWYNEEHLHSGIRYVTPGSRHRGEDLSLLSKRHDVYEDARMKNPNRWSGKTRNWGLIKEVFLNHHLKGRSDSCNRKAA